jgi:type I site-specific restriction endonuclease
MSEFFGEVIYKYTEEQAIQDGVKADLGFHKTDFGTVRITATTGFTTEINTLQAMHILLTTIEKIRPDKPNWIVFQKGVKDHTKTKEEHS